jgi:hypothetical protein
MPMADLFLRTCCQFFSFCVPLLIIFIIYIISAAIFALIVGWKDGFTRITSACVLSKT